MMPALFTHLWQSTLCALAMAAAAFALRRYRAGVRHGLWLAASLKFLVPVALLVSLGQQMPFARRTAAPELPARFSVVRRATSTDGPRAEPIAVRFAIARRAESAWTTPLRMVEGVWVLGALMLLGRFAGQWWRVRRLVRQAAPLTRGREIDALERVRLATGISTPLDIRVTDAAVEPGVFGIRTPVLLWPRGLSARLSDGEIESILAHELAHVARRDNASALVHQIVQALFWINPVVWWIGARLIDERERACDEQVVQTGGERETYARSILTTCAFAIEAPVACVSGVTGADLDRRIAEIVGGAAGRPLGAAQRLGLRVGACAAIAAPFVFGVFNAPLQARPARVLLQRLDVARPTFEVASVRENVSGTQNVSINIRPGGALTVTNMTLADMMRFAYQMQSFQIVGGPDWVRKTRYDVIAKVGGEVPATPPGLVGPMQLMMQSLLAERFALRARPDTREMPIYALIVARPDRRLGPQLTPSTVDCDAIIAAARRGGPPPPRPAPGQAPVCGMQVTAGRMRAGGFPLSELARSLGAQLQRAVVDETRLSDNFDLDLSYTPEQMPSNLPLTAAPVDANGPSLFAALQEQLGLKLEARRAPVDVLVVEGADLPAPE